MAKKNNLPQVRRPSPKPGAAESRPSSKPRTTRPVAIVGIGGSAGSLESFREFFAYMPPDSGMAFVLIPHLDPTHKGMMPEIIARFTSMPVTEARDELLICANSVYIIPPNKSMQVARGRLKLTAFTAPRGQRSPIDCFLEELAKDQGSRAIAIILSGMGTDGVLGLQTVKENFGLTLAQEPGSAMYDGMPQAAIATGLVDYVLPLRDMPAKLMAYVTHALHDDKKLLSERALTTNLSKIFALLRTHTDHDFSLYKKSTIHRRVERRMHLHQLGSLGKYVQFLQANPHEVELLLKELLISVTSFFRDPDSFAALAERVLPALVKSKAGDSLRVWVPGCSTGEEAYSLSVLIAECVEHQKLEGQVQVQIFATDINGDAVDRARQGFYRRDIEGSVSPERLRRFFVKEDQGYRVQKRIRETVVFAPQNMIMDPPFTRLDLISCRNVLIYFTAELQQKLLPLFHYALAPDGVLFLGSAETTGSSSNLFTTLDPKSKIYRRREVAGSKVRKAYPKQAMGMLTTGRKVHSELSKPRPYPEIYRELLLKRFAPPSVLINQAGEILFFHGKTGLYLEPASGEASLNLFTMAREGLRLQLGGLIRQALDHKRAVVARDVRVESGALVNVRVDPLPEMSDYRGLLLVAFEPVPEAKQAPGKSVAPKGKQGKRVRELEQQLARVNGQLSLTIEEMDTSREELRSANEELQSMNEELQSTNEELITSKEEMQSMNEELITLNSELADKIENLSRSNSDMKNLLNSTDLATIFVYNALRVKRFTSQTAKVVNLIPTDIGRPLTDLTTHFKDDRLAEEVMEVVEKLATKEWQVETKTGQWFLVRALPYRTLDNVIDGAVVTFTDITPMKLLERSREENEKLIRHVLERMPVMLAALAPDHTITLWNRECERVTGYASSEVVGNPDVMTWLIPDPAYRAAILAEHSKLDGNCRDWEVQVTCKDGTVKTVAFSNVSKSVEVPGWSDWAIARIVSDEGRSKA